MTKCALKICSREGIRVPIICVSAYPGGAELKGELSITFCAECSRELALSDIMDDVGFETIALNLEKAGYARPERSTARLTWRDI